MDLVREKEMEMEKLEDPTIQSQFWSYLAYLKCVTFFTFVLCGYMVIWTTKTGENL